MQHPSSRFAVVGSGRLGTALHRALVAAGFDAGDAPLGRGASGSDADVVVMCVPDRAIAEAAAAIEPGRLVVHTSGAGSVDLAEPHARRGVLHPLISVPTGDASLEGACAAIRATDPADAAFLRSVAERLGMLPIEVAEEDRTAYHAAASLASNALVALQVAAAELAATAGVPASALQPLARAALAQVGQSGPAALTGPAARGDWATVAAQRSAIEARTPHLLPLFDATTAACADLAGKHAPSPVSSESA